MRLSKLVSVSPLQAPKKSEGIGVTGSIRV